MKRSAAILCVAGLALLSFCAAARAQSADLVLCDRIAADPADPDKPADVPGVTAIAKSDVATALKFCKSAAASSRRALYQLGRAYAANGQTAEALATYRKAVDKGSTSAMVELGVVLGTGSGVARDPDAARKLFERAAAAGNARGVTNLAAVNGGGGTPANPVEARAQLSKAAQANIAEAQFQLGLMLADGEGGAKAGRRTKSARALCSKRPPRKTTSKPWSGPAPLRNAASVARKIRRKPKPISRGPPRSAMKTPRPRSSASSAPMCSRTSAAR